MDDAIFIGTGGDALQGRYARVPIQPVATFDRRVRERVAGWWTKVDVVVLSFAGLDALSAAGVISQDKSPLSYVGKPLHINDDIEYLKIGSEPDGPWGQVCNWHENGAMIRRGPALQITWGDGWQN